MEENRKTIEESNCIEQENYQTKAAINMLREKNRLFDKLQTQTAKQINLLNVLLNRYEEEEELEKSRILLVKISLIGTYKKTRKSRVYRRKIKSIRRRRAGSLYRGILFQFTIVRY